MKTMKKTISITFALLMITGTVAFSQNREIAEAFTKDYSSKKQNMKKESKLKTYVIERDMPGAGALTAEQLKEVSQLSNSVSEEQGPDIEWLHSYVTADKIFCVFKAVDENILNEHAEKAGFPVTAINQLATVINPETATAMVH
ncbi:MAG: DUF4242 domain-containing protein [Bacteroidota bacterium]